MASQTARFVLRNRDGDPSICVVIKDRKDGASYGVSICSMRDKFSLKEGYKKAENRAMKARYYPEPDDPMFIVRPEADEVIHDLCYNDYHRLRSLMSATEYGYESKSGIVHEDFMSVINDFTKTPY